MRFSNVLTLLASLHSTNNAAPSIHNTFPEGNNVVVHFITRLRTGGHSGRLLKDLRNNGQILLEMPTNGGGNITKALQDSRLELVGQGRRLEKKMLVYCVQLKLFKMIRRWNIP